MKNKYFIITLFTLLLLSFSCENDDNTSVTQTITPSNNNPETFLQNFGNTVSHNFLGRVVDINNNPIEDVRITIGNAVAFTDDNGVFNITDASVLKSFGYVKAEKAGYIHGSSAMIPAEGTNKVTIMLLEETVAGTTTSGETATISLSNGASVALNGNYIKEDGTNYNGNVNVILHHLDPTDDNMTEQMPGMLLAANAEDEPVMLKTLGMLAVELRGDNGEDLNLAENSSAEIRIPVASELLSEAPSTIPLWYFDEENGYWIEEGEAQLIGNEYIGTVTHFSFWNCDIPIRYNDLCINLTDAEGNPIYNTLIKLTSTTYGTTIGVTNDYGQVCGIIPSGEILTIDVIHDCNTDDPIYTSTIGPFSTATTIDIVLEAQDITPETIRGSFVDCDGNPVMDGYVILGIEDNAIIHPISNGVIDLTIIRCNDQNDFTFRAVDNTNQQTTAVFPYTFNDDIINIGVIYACDELETYVTYQIDDKPVITYTENLRLLHRPLVPHKYQVRNSHLGYYEGFRLQYKTQIPGVYSSENNEIILYTDIDTNGDKLDTEINQNSIHINIINSDQISKIADITFYGTYTDDTGEHTITGRVYGNNFSGN